MEGCGFSTSNAVGLPISDFGRLRIDRFVKVKNIFPKSETQQLFTKTETCGSLPGRGGHRPGRPEAGPERPGSPERAGVRHHEAPTVQQEDHRRRQGRVCRVALAGRTTSQLP